MGTTVPTWIKETAAAGNAKPLVIWNLGLDPSDPAHWAWAVSERLVEQPDGTLYEPAPGREFPPPDVRLT